MILPSFLDIIDILLVAFLLFGVYKVMKNSGAINIFYGLLAFMGIWVIVSYVFKLRLFGSILDKVVSVGAIALIVLFQNEIRRFLVMIGSRKQWNNMVKLFSVNDRQQNEMQDALLQIVLACKNMAGKKIGALIVIEKNVKLDDVLKTGERIGGIVSAPLLETIFFKNSPLHDGAVVITKTTIEAAACILPVSASTDIPKHYGLRHRSALGIAQQSDAVAVVVSEETGHIAFAHNGRIEGNLTGNELQRLLNEQFVPPSGMQPRKKHRAQKRRTATSDNTSQLQQNNKL